MKQLHHLALAVGETALFLFLLYGLWRLAARWQDWLDTVRAPGEGDDAPLNWAHYARSLLFFLASVTIGCDKATPEGPYARARVIGGLDEAIGGEKGVAREGDIVLDL